MHTLIEHLAIYVCVVATIVVPFYAWMLLFEYASKHNWIDWMTFGKEGGN